MTVVWGNALSIKGISALGSWGKREAENSLIELWDLVSSDFIWFITATPTFLTNIFLILVSICELFSLIFSLVSGLETCF